MEELPIRLLRDWRGYAAGRVLRPTPGVADVLVRRGIAERTATRGQESAPTRKRRR